MSGTYEVIAESPRLLFVRIVGALSIPDARNLAREIENYPDQVGGPIYVLGDMSEIQVMIPGARAPLIEMMRNPRLLAGAFCDDSAA